MSSRSADHTVRVGCRMSYESVIPTPAVLAIRPRPDQVCRIVAERSTFDPALFSGEFLDERGNAFCRLLLNPGWNEIEYDAIVSVSPDPEPECPIGLATPAVFEIPSGVLRYTLPSRYCDSDRLFDFAWKQFGTIPNGGGRVIAISEWVHRNLEYRYGSDPTQPTASEVIHRGYGVCRDFAHVVVALCRAFNLPARYATGYLPRIGYVGCSNPEDFHAYCEVYLAGEWFTIDARFHCPRIGRIKVTHGLDAVDCAFTTIYGEARLSYFEVWSYEVDPREVALGDPVDLSKRLDVPQKSGIPIC